MRTKAAESATRKWTTEAAGLPCTIELTDDRCWVVTIASASTSRREDLRIAIVEASGGLVSNKEALAVAAAVRRGGGRLDIASS
jgi:hypothetical protein